MSHHPSSDLAARAAGLPRALPSIPPPDVRLERADAVVAGERTGRPLGSAAFVAGLEQQLDGPLARRKPGRRPGGPGL